MHSTEYWPPVWLPVLGNFLSEYQTLMTGLIALAVGLATVKVGWENVKGLQSQIEQADQAEEERRKRRLAAKRAGLPIALSEIHNYADECIEVLLNFIGEDGQLNGEIEYDVKAFNSAQKAIDLGKINYPSSAFETLREVIEEADTEDALRLHEIIAFGQIFNSRMRSIVSKLTQSDDIKPKDKDWILWSNDLFRVIRDAIGMLLHASSAFAYGRNTSDHIEQLGGVERAKEVLLLRSPSSEPLDKFISERWPPNFPADRQNNNDHGK